MYYKNFITLALIILVIPQTIMANSFDDDSLFEAAPEKFLYDNKSPKISQKLQYNNNQTSVDINFSSEQNANDDPQPARYSKKAQKVRPIDETPGRSKGLLKFSDDGEYSINLNGCKIFENQANCYFTITNNGKVRNFSMYGKHTGRDNFDNELRGYYRGSSTRIESATSKKFTLEFKVTPNATLFNRLIVNVDYGSSENFTFNNIHLDR